MTKILATSLIAAGLIMSGLATTSAIAGENCETACSSSKKMKAEKVAMSSDCASKCSKDASYDVAKGGEGDKVPAGYEVGQRVPDFTLADTTGTKHSLSDFDGKVKVLVFYNQACPYVVEVEDRLNDFTKNYSDKDVVTLAIDAGINNNPESISSHAEDKAYPILVDRTSNSARKFNASRTPEVFVLDRDGVVQYHGAFDNGKAGADNRRPYAEDAVKAVLSGEEPMVQNTKAFGCSIKFNPETDGAV